MKPEAKAYKESAAWQARSQYRGKPITEDLEVEFTYYFGDGRIHDQLNYNKSLADSLNQIVWKDDKQIKISHHYSMIDTKDPRVEIFTRAIAYDYADNSPLAKGTYREKEATKEAPIIRSTTNVYNKNGSDVPTIDLWTDFKTTVDDAFKNKKAVPTKNIPNAQFLLFFFFLYQIFCRSIHRLFVAKLPPLRAALLL